MVQQGNVQSLTRAGNFQLDTFGNLTTLDGQNVMGYPAVNGAIGLNSKLAPLTLPVGQTEPAQATQNIAVSANLNSAAAVGSTFSSPITVYDTLGADHLATVTYTKTSGTTWDFAVTLPPADASLPPTGNTGTLTFNSAGALISPTTNVPGGTFAGLTDGASTLSFNFNVYNPLGVATFTQSASPNTNTAGSQDGFASGTYQKFAVDANGVISATFSNAHTANVGQVAVASVTNAEGLLRVGGNNYQTTSASGTAAIGIAGTGGRAHIVDDALEASNVDISTEFANLIVAQRAFEANSKTVTTFDTVSQDVISMIR